VRSAAACRSAHRTQCADDRERRRRRAKLCTTLTTTGVMWQTIIHCVFVASASYRWTDRLMSGGNSYPRERMLEDH